MARRSSIPWMWSAWACVKSTASTAATPAATSWRRSSGGVSISRRRPPASSSAAVRLRLSRGSGEVQVTQRQPICGTPYDVPVPRNTSFTSHDLDLEQVGCAGDPPGYSGGRHDAVTGPRQAALHDEVAHHRKHRIVSRHAVHE